MKMYPALQSILHMEGLYQLLCRACVAVVLPSGLMLTGYLSLFFFTACVKKGKDISKLRFDTKIQGVKSRIVWIL